MKANRILCAVDFSPCSKAALEHATELAAANHAQLVLANVVAPPPTYFSGFAGFGALPAYRPEPDARLEALNVSISGIDLQRVHLVGMEGEAIVNYADEFGCDLIVMGTHGYGGIAKFFLGSVAEHVLRYAKCAVIVVRDKQAETVKARRTAAVAESGVVPGVAFA